MKKRYFVLSLTCILLSVPVVICPVCSFAGQPEAIKLDPPRMERGKTLMESLNTRRSSRSFSGKDIPIAVLSDLMWAAFGVNRPDTGLRTAPSAMNLQEIDLYVAMKSGLYLFDHKTNTLEPVLPEDIRELTGVQDFTQIAPVNLIFVADFSRMRSDKDSKIFYSAVDTGFISQNVYLFCASEGLSTVVLGWVKKPELKKAMGLREEQEIILTQPVGYPAE